MKQFLSNLFRSEERKLTYNLKLGGLDDNCTQTNSAELTLLNWINFPSDKMIWMSHSIRAEANRNLDIMGAILLRVK